MPIIFGYLLRQVLVSVTAVSGILLLIFLSGRFIKYLAQAAAGGISVDVLFILVLYRLPGFLELILPLGVFLGILLSYGRMYLESEMTVMYACGYSPRRLLIQSLLISSVIAVVVGVMSLYLSPLGIAKTEELLLEQSRRTEFEMLSPGKFQRFKAGGRVTYTEGLSEDKRTMLGVFIAEQSEDGRLMTTIARYGEQRVDAETGERFLLLKDGTQYQGTPGMPDYRTLEFATYGIRLEQPASAYRAPKDAAISTEQLLARNDNTAHALLQWRISLVVLVPIVAMLAVPLSKVNPRQGRFFHLLPGMLIYVVYLGLLIVSRNAIEKGQLSPLIGMWPVHLGFALLGLFMQFRVSIMQSLRLKRA